MILYKIHNNAKMKSYTLSTRLHQLFIFYIYLVYLYFILIFLKIIRLLNTFTILIHRYFHPQQNISSSFAPTIPTRPNPSIILSTFASTGSRRLDARASRAVTARRRRRRCGGATPRATLSATPAASTSSSTASTGR